MMAPASAAWIPSLVEDLCAHGVEDELEAMFELELEQVMQQEVVAPFWRLLARPGASEATRLAQLRAAFEHVLYSMRAILDALGRALAAPTDRLSRLQDCAMRTLDALLLLEPPAHFRVFVEQLLETSHRCVMRSAADTANRPAPMDADGAPPDEDDEQSDVCPGCAADTSLGACRCLEFGGTVDFLAECLTTLRLGQRLFSQPYVLQLIRGKVERHVAAQCSHVYHREALRQLERWYAGVFQTWLGFMGVDMGRLTRHRRHNGEQAQLVIYQAYAKVRIAELFDIIVDFPESRPALLELKKAVEAADMRGHMMLSAKAAIRRRLLHPGVQTEAVLSAYIAAVRALRLLDPSGVAQELVCQPITRYLRQREDAIRAIITKIISDEGAGELAAELGRPPLDGGSGGGGGVDDDDEPDMSKWNEWAPDPVEARLATAGAAQRSADLLTLLVGIYGSKELFVSEYRNLLANRLLAGLSFDTDREIRNLELLKLRFGDANLNQCEVMLKDLADSRRLNLLAADLDADAVRTRAPGLPCVTGFVLSAQFWPAFRPEQLALPAPLQRCLDDFRRCFEALKGNRTLNWLAGQGQITLEVEARGKTLEVACAPLQAAALLLFTERATWSLAELAALLQVPAFQLRRRLALWAQMGVLRDLGGERFGLLPDKEDAASGGAAASAAAEEGLLVEEEPGGGGGADGGSGCAAVSLAEQRAAELQVLWTYVVGMLTNLGSLSLERIHAMLKAFFMAGAGSVDFSRDEVKALLNLKLKEQKLVLLDDTYRLP